MATRRHRNKKRKTQHRKKRMHGGELTRQELTTRLENTTEHTPDEYYIELLRGNNYRQLLLISPSLIPPHAKQPLANAIMTMYHSRELDTRFALSLLLKTVYNNDDRVIDYLLLFNSDYVLMYLMDIMNKSITHQPYLNHLFRLYFNILDPDVNKIVENADYALEHKPIFYENFRNTFTLFEFAILKGIRYVINRHNNNIVLQDSYLDSDLIEFMLDHNADDTIFNRPVVLHILHSPTLTPSLLKRLLTQYKVTIPPNAMSMIPNNNRFRTELRDILKDWPSMMLSYSLKGLNKNDVFNTAMEPGLGEYL